MASDDSRRPEDTTTGVGVPPSGDTLDRTERNLGLYEDDLDDADRTLRNDDSGLRRRIAAATRGDAGENQTLQEDPDATHGLSEADIEEAIRSHKALNAIPDELDMTDQGDLERAPIDHHESAPTAEIPAAPADPAEVSAGVVEGGAAHSPGGRPQTADDDRPVRPTTLTGPYEGDLPFDEPLLAPMPPRSFRPPVYPAAPPPMVAPARRISLQTWIVIIAVVAAVAAATVVLMTTPTSDGVTSAPMSQPGVGVGKSK